MSTVEALSKLFRDQGLPDLRPGETIVISHQLNGVTNIAWIRDPHEYVTVHPDGTLTSGCRVLR